MDGLTQFMPQYQLVKGVLTVLRGHVDMSIADMVKPNAIGLEDDLAVGDAAGLGQAMIGGDVASNILPAQLNSHVEAQLISSVQAPLIPPGFEAMVTNQNECES